MPGRNPRAAPRFLWAWDAAGCSTSGPAAKASRPPPGGFPKPPPGRRSPASPTVAHVVGFPEGPLDGRRLSALWLRDRAEAAFAFVPDQTGGWGVEWSNAEDDEEDPERIARLPPGRYEAYVTGTWWEQ